MNCFVTTASSKTYKVPETDILNHDISSLSFLVAKMLRGLLYQKYSGV